VFKLDKYNPDQLLPSLLCEQQHEADNKLKNHSIWDFYNQLLFFCFDPNQSMKMNSFHINKKMKFDNSFNHSKAITSSLSNLSLSSATNTSFLPPISINQVDTFHKEHLALLHSIEHEEMEKRRKEEEKLKKEEKELTEKMRLRKKRQEDGDFDYDEMLEVVINDPFFLVNTFGLKTPLNDDIDGDTRGLNKTTGGGLSVCGGGCGDRKKNILPHSHPSSHPKAQSSTFISSLTNNINNLNLTNNINNLNLTSATTVCTPTDAFINTLENSMTLIDINDDGIVGKGNDTVLSSFPTVGDPKGEGEWERSKLDVTEKLRLEREDNVSHLYEVCFI
jgi:hypothetical protein